MKNGKILIVDTIDTIIKMKTMLLTEAKMLLNNHKPLPSSTTFFSSLKNKIDCRPGRGGGLASSNLRP